MNTLYGKLALTLMLLLLVLGAVQFQLMRHASQMYQQEVTQRLNRDLAQHIVADQPLMTGNAVNATTMASLFHDLMVINPSIELYLLDPRGEILSYSAPAGSVRAQRVPLDPVRTFLHGDRKRTVLGLDPRHPRRSKAFSAAEIRHEGRLAGYLYIILGSELYDSAAAQLRGSFIMGTVSTWLMGVLVVTAIAGALVFAGLTRRLTRLNRRMREYAREHAESPETPAPPARTTDEIAQLAQQFERMSHQIDRQLQRLRRQDAARRDMVANISHDLRTPLTTLQGYLETLQLKGPDLTESDRRQYLEVALAHGRQLSRLVTELFDLATLDASERVILSEPFSLAELIQDVAQKLALPARQRGIRLEASVSPGIPLVHGDIAMIQRVLENLVENALRHTPEGGSVAMGVAPTRDAVVVRVRDTGSGIPAGDLPHIFERFYRVDKSRSGDTHGTGLGLAIVRRILELHGTFIQVDSRLNQGTTFSFEMPVRRD